MKTTHIQDLTDGLTACTVDVCILGAGAAGIYLASRLCEYGVSVALLEAGNNACADSVSIGMEANMTQDHYSGATSGRAFGLGGTTSLWGGQMVPHTCVDIQRQEESGFNAWRHIVDVTSKYSAAVKNTLSISNSKHSDVVVEGALGSAQQALLNSGLDVMASEFLPFRRKNFKFLLDRMPKDTKLQLFLGAAASSYEFANTPKGLSQLRSVCVDIGQKKLRVTARSFVIAAGTIESTRILLEMNAQNGGSVVRKGAMVGRYLSDHLSLAIAHVDSSSLPMAARLFAPRFSYGRMRSFRFYEQQAIDGYSRYFTHFIFDNENPGFEVAKKILAGFQSRQLPGITFNEFINGSSGLTGLAWNRFVRSRLYIPTNTAAHLQLDIEQAPDIGNRITLGKELDSYGRPIVEISWKINSLDYANIRETARQMLAKWPGPEGEFPQLNPIDKPGVGEKPYDAYHPVGTCRIGEDQESVVSPNLSVHGTSNVSLLSTAIFPTAGSANPTFGMLCFAERLAESLSTKQCAGT